MSLTPTHFHSPALEFKTGRQEREGFSREEWRHTPACIQNAPNTEGRQWHHCTYVTLPMTSLALSLSALLHLKHLFLTLSTPTYAPIPSCGDCVGCVYVLRIEGGHSSIN